MDRWNGRVALVTGASAGMGAAIVKELVLKGMKVIGVARRVEKIEAFQAELQGASGKLYPFAGDVSKEEDILAVFEWANNNLGGVDVLINNAAIPARNGKLTEAQTERWKEVLDLNVIGLSMCTREAIKSMRARGVDDGHIIHIGSNLGYVVGERPGSGVYSASKFAARALAEALRKELVALNSRIRVTYLSPGVTKTEFGKAASNYFDDKPHLEAQDIADGVVHVLGAPENVQVQITELIIRPVGQVS